jgi:hypothetical protein
MNTQSDPAVLELTAGDVVKRAVDRNQELLQEYNLLSDFRRVSVAPTFGEVLANTQALCKKLKLSTGPNKDLLLIDYFCRELSAAFFLMSNSEHEKKSLEAAGFHFHTEIDLNFRLQKVIIKNHKLLASNLVIDEASFCFEVDDARFCSAPVKDKINYLNDCLVFLRQIFIATNHGDSLSVALCQYYRGDITDIFIEKRQGNDRVSEIVNHVYSCVSKMTNKAILFDRVERGTQLTRLAFSFMAMELGLSHKPSYRWLVLLRNFKFNLCASPVTAQKIFNGPGPLAGLAKKIKLIKNLGSTQEAKDVAADIIKELVGLSGIGLEGGRLLDAALDFNRLFVGLGGELGFAAEELEACELMFLLPVVYCSREHSQQVSNQKKAIVGYFYTKFCDDLSDPAGAIFHRRFFLLVNAVVFGQEDAVKSLLAVLSKLVNSHEIKKAGSQVSSPQRARDDYLLNKINPVVQASLDFYGFSLPADSLDAERYIIFLKMLIGMLSADVEAMADGKDALFQSKVVRVMALLGGSFWSATDNVMTMFCSNVYAWVDDAQGQLACDGVVGLARNIVVHHARDFAKRSYYFNKLSQGEMLPSVGRSAEDKATQSFYNQVFPETKGVYSQQQLEIFCQNVDGDFGALQASPARAPMTPERPSKNSGSEQQESPEQKNFERSSEKLFSAIANRDLSMYGSPGRQSPARQVLVMRDSPGKQC